MENLRLADDQPQAKTPIVDPKAAEAIFVFSRSWSRAATPQEQEKKPTSARSFGRS